jgi:protein phosphatase
MSMGEFWQWASSAVSHVGNVRTVNEDALLDSPQRGLWAVADGMGGHEAGAFASSEIVRALRGVGPHRVPREFVDDVEDRLIRVNAELYARSQQDGACDVIGSTVAVLLALPGQCACLWAGDSRIYRFRDFTLEQITTDHSEVEALIADGLLDRNDAQQHADENVITRAVGGAAELMLESRLFTLHNKDRVLICSDGLYKEVTFSEIGELMAEGSVADVCVKLLDRVLSRRGADNVSIIAIDFELR